MIDWDLVTIKYTPKSGNQYYDQFGNIWEKVTSKSYKLVKCERVWKDNGSTPVQYVANRTADGATIKWVYSKVSDDSLVYKEEYDIRKNVWNYFEYDSTAHDWKVCYKDNDYYFTTEDHAPTKDSVRYSKVGVDQFGIHSWKMVDADVDREYIGNDRYMDQFGNIWLLKNGEYLQESARVWLLEMEYVENLDSNGDWIVDQVSYGTHYRSIRSQKNRLQVHLLNIQNS